MRTLAPLALLVDAVRLGVLAGALIAAAATDPLHADQPPTRDQILQTMKRATRFMVEEVSTNGGYVWNYLPDRTRRWGELEARPTQIWIQPPGTATMGNLFLDAYAATRDEYYYQAAEGVAGALIWAQHPSGGWNYLADFAGEQSLAEWYATIGRNAWRLEEFQHNWGNATFDDAGTIEAARLLLRLYVTKREPRYRPALDRAIAFVLDSQYPIGAWPQRFPLKSEFSKPGYPDYTAYYTFNDDVAGENIEFLVQCYQVLGDSRVRDAITRGMSAFLVTQQGPPQAGWALQYTPDLKPATARTYEPRALATHTTAANVGLLMKFYRLTGDGRYLARIPEALEWLDSVALPPGVATRPGTTHPTFVEIGTNRPLYVHRSGTNVVNGAYYVNDDPKGTVGHYSAFRRVDVAALRAEYGRLRATPVTEVVKDSPLVPGASPQPLPRFFAVDLSTTISAAEAVTTLNAEGYWLVPLGQNSHPYAGQGSKETAAIDAAQSHVGDQTDTSPFPDPKLTGISTAAYIRRMSALINALASSEAPTP